MLAGVGAVALLASAGVAALPGTGDRLVQDTLAAQTDRVQFGSDFQTDVTPVEMTGQWAWTSVQTDVDTTPNVLESPYATQQQPGQTATYSNTTLCVDGGAGPSCQPAPVGRPADSAAATTSGRSETYSWSAGLLNPEVTFEAVSDLTTGARCWVGADGSLHQEATRPGGKIQTSGRDLLVHREHQIDVGTVDDGETETGSYSFGVNLGLLGLLHTHAQMEVTPRWGTNGTDHTAYSEVEIRYQASSAALDVLGVIGVGVGASDLITYTVRSECGVTANDGSGVTGPAARPALAAAPMGIREAPSDGQTTVTSTTTEVPSIAVDDSALVAEYSLTVPEAAFPFEVRAERDLSPSELDLVAEALTDVALSQDTTSGELPGISWEIHSADGVFQLVPRVAMELDDGTVIVASPDLTATTTTTTTPTTRETTPATETTTPSESEPTSEPAPDPTPTTAASTTAEQ